jgi:hypothetical protein
MRTTIDDETADRITVCSLRSTIRILKNSIAKLQDRKYLQDFEKEDLANHIEDLAACKIVYRYYGGHYE